MEAKIYLEKRDCYQYPSSEAYFSPHIQYPEYPFSKDTLSSFPNEIYDMVRNSLYGLGLDKQRFGTKEWNPLGDYVQHGKRILLKPNWVVSSNVIGGLDCTVTHPSIIRCLVDYCIIAGAKTIEIGDAPVQGCDFNLLMEKHGYNRIFVFFRNRNIDILVTDFRLTITKTTLKRVLLPEKNPNIKPKNTVEFDLKEASYFNSLTDKSIYQIADYHSNKLNTRHNADHHQYLISKAIVDADLIINLPKPKTHRFAGITAAQKNFIGICSDKEYLPHYRKGTPQKGGDESNHSTVLGNWLSFFNKQRCKCVEKKNIPLQFLFAVMQYGTHVLKDIFVPKQYAHGKWHGNDTIWRTILDLNLILLYGDSNGTLDFNATPRNVLNIGDLIIAGEKNGPLKPEPKPLGVILASNNCTVFDYVFCKITGFDYNLIPAIRHSINNKLFVNNLTADILLNSNVSNLNNVPLSQISFPSEWHFIPNPSWKEIL